MASLKIAGLTLTHIPMVLEEVERILFRFVEIKDNGLDDETALMNKLVYKLEKFLWYFQN